MDVLHTKIHGSSTCSSCTNVFQDIQPGPLRNSLCSIANTRTLPPSEEALSPLLALHLVTLVLHASNRLEPLLEADLRDLIAESR